MWCILASMIPQFPTPAINQRQLRHLGVDFAELYAHWRIGFEIAHPAPPIENMRFVHDPHWREGIFSITSARQRNHWVWKATSVLFTLGASYGAAGGLLVGTAVAPTAVLGLALGIYMLTYRKRATGGDLNGGNRDVDAGTRAGQDRRDAQRHDGG